jgi:ligand-binding SRPBCC domain-containing protein
MFRVKESLHVNAPAERCFLLATSIPLVQQILGMKPVEGKTTGLIVDGDRIVWKGWKFGLPAKHETLITGYDRPSFFQDTMGQGMFAYFQHDHRFQAIDGQTLMADVVHFSLPFGPAGHVVGKYILVPYVLKLMQTRFAMLKRIAEGPDWQRYLVDSH